MNQIPSTSKLILVRHGQSRWNLSNRFTGWVDVSLTPVGVEEALSTSNRLKDIKIQHAFTSTLERAHETLNIILSQQELTGIYLHPDEDQAKKYTCAHHSEDSEIFVHVSNSLNERYYGELQGLDKHAVRQKYGEEIVALWRRSFRERPPSGESLQDVYDRAVPFFKEEILPLLESNKNIIVSSHGNTLRALLKYIENVSDENVPFIELPPGQPIIYTHSNGTFSRDIEPLQFNRPLTWTSL